MLTDVGIRAPGHPHVPHPTSSLSQEFKLHTFISTTTSVVDIRYLVRAVLLTGPSGGPVLRHEELRVVDAAVLVEVVFAQHGVDLPGQLLVCEHLAPRLGVTLVTVLLMVEG